MSALKKKEFFQQKMNEDFKIDENERKKITGFDENKKQDALKKKEFFQQKMEGDFKIDENERKKITGFDENKKQDALKKKEFFQQKMKGEFNLQRERTLTGFSEQDLHENRGLNRLVTKTQEQLQAELEAELAAELLKEDEEDTTPPELKEKYKIMKDMISQGQTPVNIRMQKPSVDEKDEIVGPKS